MESFDEKIKRSAERLGLIAEQIPRHLAIIMDGNGRWAQQRSMPRVEGHREGGKIVEEIVLHCVAVGIESLTLYSFSVENWRRPKYEIQGLMHLYVQYLVSIRNLLMTNNVKLIHLGRRADLPRGVLKELDTTMEMTAGNSGLVLALALWH